MSVRLRAVIVVAVSWGMLWMLVGAALGVSAMVRWPGQLGAAVFSAGFMGICGVISGAGFAALLSRKRVSGGKLPSLMRSATIGAVGAGSMSFLLLFIAYIPTVGVMASITAMCAGLGALSAVTLVGMARRAPSGSTQSDPRRAH